MRGVVIERDRYPCWEVGTQEGDAVCAVSSPHEASLRLSARTRGGLASKPCMAAAVRVPAVQREVALLSAPRLAPSRSAQLFALKGPAHHSSWVAVRIGASSPVNETVFNIILIF